MIKKLVASLTAVSLTACGPPTKSGPLDVAVIGQHETIFDNGVRLSVGAQHLYAATNEGLVALDPAGQVIPAIAERWIVTDDGLSYIFRLRDSDWPNGSSISAADVRILLQDRLRRLEGSSLGLDLAKVVDVRAMTGRVVEVRLSAPMPEFLRLLAQPELGFAQEGSGAGPMIASRDPEERLARLSSTPPQDRGLPSREDWNARVRGITFRALPSQAAVDAFSSGSVDLLLNGTIADFPMAQLGPLSRGTVQVDPTFGLLGLMIKSDEGILADPERREALSMAIDRAELIEPFGLGGWQATTWIIPPQTFDGQAYPNSRWGGQSIEERRQIARQRIEAWRSDTNQDAVLRIGLPEGPGSNLLFEHISFAWGQIGITSVRVELGAGAEIELLDRLARYSSPRWYLNQFNCSLNRGICSSDVDEIVRETLAMQDPIEKRDALLAAHAQLVEKEAYVPLGVPVRWSLVRGAVEGYQANPWGLHSLFPLTSPTM